MKRRSTAVLAVIPAYARWAANYPPFAHNALMELEEALMRQQLPPLAGKRVLDLACGSGRYTRIAEEQQARDVISLDISRAMLMHGQQAGILHTPLEATLNALPLQAQSIDVVICGLALGHLPTIEGALAEIARVLAPAGIALVSDLHASIFQKGAQRTFTADDGKRYAVEHYPHNLSDYQQVAESVGLRVSQVQTAHHDGRPVVWVMRFIR